MPIGTSMRPVLFTRPASAKTLVPLLFSVPMPANQSPPLRRMGAMLAKVSTLLISVGQPHRPDSAGKGGRGRGWPRLPFDGGDQRGFLAADKGAGAQPDLDVEAEVGAADALAQHPAFSACLMAVLEALDGQRILGAHVDVALAGAHRIAAMIMPSSTRWGSLSSTLRSMNAPGSPSSPLQMTYFFSPRDLATVLHLRPVGSRRRRARAARWRSFRSTTSAGVMSVRARPALHSPRRR
jgi:hypothetical protein